MTINRIPENMPSMFKFMVNIRNQLIKDETLMRLLVYRPEGFSVEDQVDYPDPLSDLLPNIVDEDSSEYWEIADDKVRKGEKFTNINEEIGCYIYVHEGRDRPIFGSPCSIEQEVVLSVYIHELFEEDWRMSRIKDRLTALLVHEIGVAGYGKLEYLGGDPRDATTGYRRIDYRYEFSTAKKRKYS